MDIYTLLYKHVKRQKKIYIFTKMIIKEKGKIEMEMGKNLQGKFVRKVSRFINDHHKKKCKYVTNFKILLYTNLSQFGNGFKPKKN